MKIKKSQLYNFNAQDFYKTLSDFEIPEIYDLWGRQALEAILLTGNVEEIKLNKNKPKDKRKSQPKSKGWVN